MCFDYHCKRKSDNYSYISTITNVAQCIVSDCGLTVERAIYLSRAATTNR